MTRIVDTIEIEMAVGGSHSKKNGRNVDKRRVEMVHK